MELISPANEAEEPPDGSPWSFVPPVPTSVSATDIPEPFLQELALKALRAYEKPTAAELSRIIALHPRVVDEILNPLKGEGLCEIEAGSGVQFRYRLSEAGKRAANDALQRSRYVGAAPVSVKSYNAAIAEQITRFTPPPLERIREAVRHMVLPDELVEDIGQAFFSRRRS